MSNGLAISTLDITDWNVIVDSLYIEIFEGGDAFKYTVTRTELELKSFHPSLVPNADFIMRATR